MTSPAEQSWTPPPWQPPTVPHVEEAVAASTDVDATSVATPACPPCRGSTRGQHRRCRGEEALDRLSQRGARVGSSA